MFWSTVTGFYGWCVFRILRHYQTVLWRGDIILYFHCKHKSSPFSLYRVTLCSCYYFVCLSHCNWYVMIIHNFTVHINNGNNMECIFIFLLYFLFGKISLHIFCPDSNWIVYFSIVEVWSSFVYFRYVFFVIKVVHK